MSLPLSLSFQGAFTECRESPGLRAAIRLYVSLLVIHPASD